MRSLSSSRLHNFHVCGLLLKVRSGLHPHTCRLLLSSLTAARRSASRSFVYLLRSPSCSSLSQLLFSLCFSLSCFAVPRVPGPSLRFGIKFLTFYVFFGYRCTFCWLSVLCGFPRTLHLLSNLICTLPRLLPTNFIGYLYIVFLLFLCFSVFFFTFDSYF